MNESFNKIKNHLESSSACKQALQPLKKGVEIGLVLDESQECAVGRRGQDVFVESRPAVKPDVIFKMNADAVDPVCNTPDDVGQLGITVMKQIKQGNIRLSVPGNLFSLLRNGYIEIVKLGGKTIWNYLSEHGITNPAKVAGLIKKIKNRNQ